MRIYKGFIASVLLAVVLNTAACAARTGVKVGMIPPPIKPTTTELGAAHAYVEADIKESHQKKLSKKSVEVKRVQKVFDRLTIAAGFPLGTFPLYVVDAGATVNAMAVNSSVIVVYSELLNKVKSDDELAVVLAHEMGHILGRHAQEQDTINDRQKAVTIGSSILGVVASVATSAVGLNGVSDLAGSVTESTTGMLAKGAFVRSFDRDQENEADHVGLMLMAKAGYDPAIAPALWSRSEEIFGDKSSQVGAFFSTHPAESDREENLREALPLAQQYYAASALNEAAVKKGAKVAAAQKRSKKAV